MSNQVRIEKTILTDIVNAVNTKINQQEQMYPQNIAENIESIVTLDETLDGDVVAWGRDIPTLKFVDPETQEDKKEISLTPSKSSDTVTIETTSDGEITVESKDQKVVTVEMTEAKKFMVTNKSDRDAKTDVEVKIAKSNTYAQKSKLISVSFIIPPPLTRVDSVSTTASPDVSYEAIPENITPAEVTLMSKAISNQSAISNTATEVYVNGNRNFKISCGKEGYTQVSMPLNGVTYKFNVIGFNHDPLTNASAYGSTTATDKAGITFQMADCFNTKYPMNSSNTNVGGWEASIMRTQTMPLLKSYMPSDWQSIIKPVNKISGVGGGASSGLQTTSDELFLLSEGEIFCKKTFAQADEVTATPQYPWYSADNVNGRRVKNCNGSACNWWERSAHSGGSNRFCNVYGNGGASGDYASLSRGVPFGFCV